MSQESESKLRRQRKLDGLTLEEVSVDCGISIGRLSEIERGMFGRLDFEDAEAICRVYRVTTSDLSALRRGAQP